MRPCFYLLWNILTCCCSHGATFDKSENFDWSIISFNYIEFKTSYHGDFKNYGKGDIEFTKSIDEVKKIIEAKEPKKEEEPKPVSKFREMQY